ncbi:MAG: hypothetical protein QM576_09775 [Rhodopseudomonas sp.]|uniref:hypothetical protein n=1 Tax=Rhodopseudomonas sp. TaxID=1078 RepID=UPI0039E21D99
MMGRPGHSAAELFTSREIALAAGLTARNFALLNDEGLAPEPLNDGRGKAGHRSYDGVGLAHAALIGALHLAGFELLISARLAAAFAEDYRLSYGKLPSNLAVYAQSPLNPTPGRLPWTDRPDDLPVDIDHDYWFHQRLRNRSTLYQRGVALRGDFIIDIADHAFVMTEHLGLERIKIYSPVSGGLPANPDCRIVGGGAEARVIPVHEELDSLDFSVNPKAAEQLRKLERDYLNARENAVSRVRINLSLAIRNAFDRLQDDRGKKAA